MNRTRIGMWGHSMDGHITLRATVVNPETKAIVIWAGVVAPYPQLFSDLQRWGAGTPDDPRALLLATYGQPDANPKAHAAPSPNAFLGNLNGSPLELHHSTGDTHVPYSFSAALASDLKAAKLPYTLYTSAHDDHDLSRNLGVALRRSVAFFRTSL